MQTEHDIVIIGAGLVGLCLAKLLSDLPLSIGVIEAHDIPVWDPEQYSLRVSALSAASQQVLQRAGVWNSIESSRASPFKDMRVWEQGINSSQALHFSATDSGVESLGAIVENELIRSCLKKSIDNDSDTTGTKSGNKAKLTWYVPDRLDSISVTESFATAHLKSGTQLQAKLVIAADGANSVTRRKLALPEVVRSYEQSGVVAEFKTQKPHGDTAYQRFHEQEVMGLLPLANGNCSMVWSCSKSKADALIKMSREALARAVSEFSQNILGNLELINDVKAFPLQLLHSRQYVSERVVLCGDAAHAVHPLAGQGVNLGLLDAAVLADVLTKGWENNYDLGDLSLLREYERQRKGNNVRMMAVLDALFGLFQSSNPVLQQARRIGMGMVNQVTPIKNVLIEQALGLKSL